jgi:hypothetical protein
MKRLRKLRLRGFAPEYGDKKPLVPEGFKVKGISTLVNAKGKTKVRWIKSEPDANAQRQWVEQVLLALKKDLKPLPAPPASALLPKVDVDDNLVNVIPLGDPHVGLLTWKPETGENFDIKIAEPLYTSAVQQIVHRMPKAKQALLISLGDYYHYENMEGVTAASGHSLDRDGRYAYMIQAGLRIFRSMVSACLETHEKVHIIIEIGNHDQTNSIFLAAALAEIYKEDPRITVDVSPALFHWFVWGKCLIGVHHGHTAKPNELPLLMATDMPVEWGASKYRYWYIGHVHHKTVLEVPGVTLETFNTLAAQDAWHKGKGYRAKREIKGITLHKEFGEVGRTIMSLDHILDGMDLSLMKRGERDGKV